MYEKSVTTSGYATWFTAGDAIRIAHYDIIRAETTSPMKSSELSNGENRIALGQLLQKRKLRHL